MMYGDKKIRATPTIDGDWIVTVDGERIKGVHSVEIKKPLTERIVNGWIKRDVPPWDSNTPRHVCVVTFDLNYIDLDPRPYIEPSPGDPLLLYDKVGEST